MKNNSGISSEKGAGENIDEQALGQALSGLKEVHAGAVKDMKLLDGIRGQLAVAGFAALTLFAADFASDVINANGVAAIRSSAIKKGEPDPLVACHQHLREQMAKIKSPVEKKVVLTHDVHGVGCMITITPEVYIPRNGGHSM